MTATANAIKLAHVAANAAADKLAENIIAWDVTELTPLNDVLILASARNERQVNAIADEVEVKMAEAGVKTLLREGKSVGRWVLLHFGEVIVHVMHEEERVYYSLERLYKDQPVVKLELAEHPESM
ncbi:MAG: ribosome silencing factor [Actinomycetales bacterium]|nr:ribosome silencing factor [Actinomycetales bacterium]